jgi:hypothetical protein
LSARDSSYIKVIAWRIQPLVLVSAPTPQTKKCSSSAEHISDGGRYGMPYMRIGYPATYSSVRFGAGRTRISITYIGRSLRLNDQKPQNSWHPYTYSTVLLTRPRTLYSALFRPLSQDYHFLFTSCWLRGLRLHIKIFGKMVDRNCFEKVALFMSARGLPKMDLRRSV